MSELKFDIGDTVKHKSSDFKMVISVKSEGKTKKYECRWYYPEKSKSGDYGFVNRWFDEFELEAYSDV